MKRKYSIFKLAQIARRIVRRKSGSLQQLVKNRKLTKPQHAYHVARIRGCDEANQALKADLASRNISGRPLRDSKLRRIWAPFPTPPLGAPVTFEQLMAANAI